MTELKKALEPGNTSDLRKIITQAVIAVDNENSTHINSDGVGRKQLTDRIMERAQSLKDILSSIDTGIEFIEYVAKSTTKVDEKHNARTNLSFASKFAHYACFYMFEEDNPKRDNFSIYDNVLKKALPIYIKKYNLDDYNLDSYSSYYRCIGEIIKCSGEDLSRNGIDHLIWYYYKARLDSIKLKRKKVSPSTRIKENSQTTSKSFTTQEAYEYILSLKEEAKRNGKTEIIITALDIAHHFKRNDRIVQICRAMRKAKNQEDVILHTHPKGNSTSFKIKYKL